MASYTRPSHKSRGRLQPRLSRRLSRRCHSSLCGATSLRSVQDSHDGLFQLGNALPSRTRDSLRLRHDQ